MGMRVITTDATLIQQQGASIRQRQQPGAASLSLKGVTHLLSTIPPGRETSDPVLRTLGPLLQQQPLRWVGYLSTTGIYGDTDGQWVRETDPPKATQERSRRRLACEQEWLNSGLPVQILRLPGIYGPGRSPLAAVKAGTLQPIDKPGQVFCRVHIDDIAAACLHLMHCSQRAPSKGGECL